MKKIIIIMFVFLLLISNVFGIDNQNLNANINMMTINGNHIPKELININFKVINDTTIRNVERFRETHQYNFSNYDSVDVMQDLDTVRITAIKRIRFLFFDVNAEENVLLDQDGNFQSRKRNLWQLFLDMGLATQND